MARQKRPGGLSSLPLRVIHAELRRRARRAATLQRRRDRLARRIEALDEQIRSLGGSAARRNGRVRGGGRRAHNKQTLVASLHEVLNGKTMRVTEAAQAVQQAGYKTGSRSFRVQVNIALIKNPKLFRRVGRGQYTAK